MKIILYRGYLRSDGKHAKTKIIGKKLLSFETVRRDTSYIGVLSDDFIMVDVDSMTEAKKLLKIVKALNIGCSVLETRHGMHFYFQGYDLSTNKIAWYTPIGIKADFKLGIKNTADPLRIDGKSRKWLLKAKIHDQLPPWLIPLSNKINHVGDLAKILSGNGVNIGANRLFKWLRVNGYLISGNRTDRNMPTQKSMELGLFQIKETVINHSDGHTSISKTSKVTGKGQQYFINKFLA